MEIQEVLDRIESGEDTSARFCENIKDAAELSSEMAAFSNTHGGYIFLGIRDNAITGLTREDIRKANQMISNAASEMVHPALYPETEIIMLQEKKKVLVIKIKEGISKPYFDKDGVIWVKSGADKRRITAREELQRMFQSEKYINADECPVEGLTEKDIDLSYFTSIYNKMYGEPLEYQILGLNQLLENMNLAKNGCLSLTGALCFSKCVSFFRPMFIVKAVCYPGKDISIDTYNDSRDFSGKLEDVYNGAMAFILRNMKYFSASRIAFEELVANALTHRTFHLLSPVRIFIYENRIEIISPGSLPGSLTIENIKAGICVRRNPILYSYSRFILPSRGLRKALEAHPEIELINDRDGNQFKAIVWYNSHT